jgi:hypothetical protein
LSSHREYLSEKVSEDGKGEEPGADGDEDPTAPFLDPWRLCLDPLDRLILGPGHPESGGEYQADESQGSDHKGKEGGLEASRGE